MFIDSPLSFPKDIRYHLHRDAGGDGATSAHLGRLLEKFCPSSQCINEPELADFHVVCEAGWLAQRDALVAAGMPAERILEMPVPIGDQWAYWDISKEILDLVCVEEDVHIPPADFARYLVDGCGRAKYDDDGSLMLSRSSYGFLQQDYTRYYCDEIMQVADALADERSREIYLNALFGVAELGWQHYVSRVFDSQQYLDYIKPAACDAVLNGGIWNGHEIPVFLAAFPASCVLHNIDPLGYDYLSPYVRASVEAAPERCREHRFALGSESGTIDFGIRNDGQAISAAVFEGAPPVSLPSITIDALVKQVGIKHVGLIKLDLEGGEPDALAGMADTLIAHRPQLAISVYHEIDHYWKLPQALIAACEDYNFYFDVYSWERFEAILYGIPAELSRT